MTMFIIILTALNGILLYGFYTDKRFKDSDITIKEFYSEVKTIGEAIFLICFLPSIIVYSILQIKLHK